MKVIAVTGGVACGKSGFTRGFANRSAQGSIGVINSDEIVADLYREPGLIEALVRQGTAWGYDFLDSAGALDRRRLRELLFDNSQFRVRVEEVVHPLVFQRIISRLNAFSDMVRMTLIEVPLLYEVDFPLNRDLDLVVATSRQVQYRRLLEVRGLEPALAERILNVQMPLADKIRRADVVVWNDGSLAAFDAQIHHLFQRCETIFN